MNQKFLCKCAVVHMFALLHSKDPRFFDCLQIFYPPKTGPGKNIFSLFYFALEPGQARPPPPPPESRQPPVVPAPESTSKACLVGLDRLDHFAVRQGLAALPHTAAPRQLILSAHCACAAAIATKSRRDAGDNGPRVKGDPLRHGPRSRTHLCLVPGSSPLLFPQSDPESHLSVPSFPSSYATFDALSSLPSCLLLSKVWLSEI